VFITFAVALILIVTGLGPHENRMIPPARTAATTAAEVQLAAVPRPTTRVGWDVSTGRPAAGTGTELTPAADRRAIERAVGTTHAATSATQKHAITVDARRGIGEG
jgi:hypothetical protein